VREFEQGAVTVSERNIREISNRDTTNYNCIELYDFHPEVLLKYLAEFFE
jgi:hypothetical protein